MTQPHRDSSLDEFHRILRANVAFKKLLTARGRLSLAEVAAIAQTHGTTAAKILTTAELDEGCTVDYARGEVRCQ